jgi:hypothetical protein
MEHSAARECFHPQPDLWNVFDHRDGCQEVVAIVRALAKGHVHRNVSSRGLKVKGIARGGMDF